MLVAERGASTNTIAAYGRDLDHFATFLDSRGVEVDAADGQSIRDYLAELARRGLSARTGARRLSAIRQFHRFLLTEGRRTDDPCAAIDSPRQGRPLPKLLSEQEVEGLLAAAHAKDGPEGMRLAALLELLYATGLRVSELVGLPAAALGRDPRFLIVRGKGDKERMVPLGEEAHRALLAYRRVRDRFLGKRARRGAERWLFPSRAEAGHLTRQRFGRMLKELALEAGIPEGVLNVVVGKGSVAGQRLIEHPDVAKIGFTGSTEVGQQVMRGAAGTIKRVTLELGGKSANVVFADADLERAAAAAPYAVFDNAGQDCCAAPPILVDRPAYDRFAELLV